MTWNEKIKLHLARMLLTTSDRLLSRDSSSFNKFLSQKAKEEQKQRFLELKQYEEDTNVEDSNVEDRYFIDEMTDDEMDEQFLNQRDVDFDFRQPDERSDDMIIFHTELEALISKHISFTSGLVIAGPLIAEALKLYRTILTQQEYDHIVSHIHETRNSVEKINLPQDSTGNTVH
jgi:hypothetical protein